jgi:hypothetical protein
VEAVGPPDESGFWDEAHERWVDLGPTTLGPPDYILPVSHLKGDLLSLQHLMSSSIPPLRMLRSCHISVAVYGFMDASGVGFGSTIALPDGYTLFRHGFWGRDVDDESSNFRELCNLVNTIEEGVLAGELVGTKLFIFTDNSTAEGAFYKGNSNSRLLFDLVLCL